MYIPAASNSCETSQFVTYVAKTIDYKRGYKVTATVRSEEKAQAVYETHPSWKEHVHFEYVSDLSREGTFDHVFANAAQPFDYVIHTASPLNFTFEDIEGAIIEPAIQG
jgi:hypothetical protein